MTEPTAEGASASLSETPSSNAPTGNGSSQEEYVVVARRYRPQTFSELIGQEHVAKSLEQAIRTGRIGHAYLFTGARGVGKTSAARILAKALNCVQGPTATPCNECEVCQSVSSGDDVDVLEIDGASNRGIDEIRQLRQNAGIRPSRVRFKVYIIDEVHMLTKEAFNALLKTLEEPPEHVKFIFATTEPNKIPITILSRCQRFDFAGIESNSIQHRLNQIAQAEGVEIDDEALQILSVRAAGSMRDSQSLLEQLLAIAGSKITGDDVNSLLGIAPAARVADLAQSLAKRDGATALSLLDETVRAGADVGQMLDQLMGYLRDVMAIAVGCPAERMLYALPAQFEQAQQLGNELGVNTLLAMLQILDQTAARMRVSLHERTLADMAIVRLVSLEDLDSLADVVAELRHNQLGNDASRPPTTRSAAVAKRTVPVTPVSSPSSQPETDEKPNRPVDASSRASSVGTSAIKGSEVLQTEQPRPPEAPKAPAGPTESTRPQSGQTQAGQVPASQRNESFGGVASDSHAQAEPTAQPASEPQTKSTGSNAMLEEFAAMKRNVGQQASNSPPPPKRLSKRQQQAEIAEQPFVKKAMELFEVEPEKLKYFPPRGR